MKSPEERVPPIYLSRLGLPVLFIVFGVLVDGIGMFMAADVSSRVPARENMLVWIGLLHATGCIAVAASLVVAKWSWRAEQHGLLAFVMMGFAYFMLSSYLGIVIFSPAHPTFRALMLVILLAYHGWWISRVVRWYGRAWHDDSLRNLIYVERSDHIVYLREGERNVRERLGVQFFPSNWTLVSTFLLGLGTYFARDNLTRYFDASWVPIAFAIWGLSLSVFVTTMVTSSVMTCFVFPSRLRRQTGKHVYVDLLSPCRPLS